MEIERLLQVMADGEWHSRASLREALEWADRVVDSQLHQLSQQGLSFESDPQLGLRLPVGLQLLDRERILRALPIGLRDSLQCFNLDLTIDSTNTAAMNWLRDGGRGAALFMAERQSAGRGRRGRTWLSPFAGNLYLSLVWPVADSGSAISGLSLVTALGVVEALQNSGLTGMERLSVKWPNDVWLGDGKLAGILLELYGSVTGSPHVVVGIGINVNLPEAIQREIGQSVTDLSAAGNARVDRSILTGNLLTSLSANFALHGARGFEAFRSRWQGLDRFQGELVSILLGEETLEGRVRGVNRDGALVVETPTGERLITGGELAPSVRAVG